MTGRIIKGVSGVYLVLTEDGTAVQCRARGRFRLDALKPLPGDIADFRIDDQENSGNVNGFIEEICERSNALVRPAVSNVTQLLAVTAVRNPAPDLLMLDRLLLDASIAGIEAAIVINKCDLDTHTASDIKAQYAAGGRTVYCTSATLAEGIDSLRHKLNEGVTVLAGQSGVGKTSLINAILPGEVRPVGELSRIERGKHTTRHAELLPVGHGFLADTPGFSLLDGQLMEPETLKEHYSEFEPFEGGCRFDGCLHASEPGCAVRLAVTQGRLNAQRYERYAILLDEARERWKRRYD